MKYFVGSWNIPLAVCNTIYSFAIMILLIVMLRDHALINEDFLTAITGYTNTSRITLSPWLGKQASRKEDKKIKCFYKNK
jgi:hypothetical protein